MLSQMAGFPSFLWLNNIPVCMNTNQSLPCGANIPVEFSVLGSNSQMCLHLFQNNRQLYVPITYYA